MGTSRRMGNWASVAPYVKLDNKTQVSREIFISVISWNNIQGMRRCVRQREKMVQQYKVNHCDGGLCFPLLYNWGFTSSIISGR